MENDKPNRWASECLCALLTKTSTDNSGPDQGFFNTGQLLKARGHICAVKAQLAMSKSETITSFPSRQSGLFTRNTDTLFVWYP